MNWITCLIDWQLLSYRANWVTGNTWGAKHTQNSPQSWHIAPLLEGAPSQCRNIQRGGAGRNCGGGWGGRTPGRRPANRVQGGDEGGRSQGRDRRSPEQKAHSRTQATAMMMVRDRADGRRSHGGRDGVKLHGAWHNGGGAGGGGTEAESQQARGDAEDLGGPRRAAAEPQRTRTQMEPSAERLSRGLHRKLSLTRQTRCESRTTVSITRGASCVEGLSGVAELSPLHRGWGWADDRSGLLDREGGFRCSSARSSKVPSTTRSSKVPSSARSFENACAPASSNRCHLSAPPLTLSPLSARCEASASAR